jgi:hypothetical protein
MPSRRLVLIGSAALLAVPAFAAETAAAFVARVYETGEAPASVFASPLREIVAAAYQPVMALLRGGPGKPRIVTLNNSGDRSAVLVMFGDAEGPSRRFLLVRRRARWLITKVHLWPEDRDLSDVLAPPSLVQAATATALPFKIDLPEGFNVQARPNLPEDFDVYDVRKGDAEYVGIYVGNAASFPTKAGVKVEVRSSSLKVAARAGRVVEYLFWTPKKIWPMQLHVWVQESVGVDAAIADRIAASVRPTP